MKQINKVQAFTLVELIVVITILAILGTIAFISLQGYSAQARDTTRISDINNIKKSLELFSLNTGKYPLPDSGTGVLYDTELVWTQGTIGNTVSTNLSRNLNEKPVDPLTESEYTYSVIGSQTKYELLSIYESDLISYNKTPLSGILSPGQEKEATRLVLETNAANANYPKISGNYNGVYVKTTSYYIPTPSIITSETIPLDFSTNPEKITSQITTGGENNIAYGQDGAKTDGLTGFTLQAFSGALDKDTGEDDNGDKELLAQALITAYSGSILENEGIYQTIATTDPTNPTDLISLVDDVILSSTTYASTSGGDNTPTITDWRSIDEHCDLPDVQIGDQTWAGCNSTLGTGIEYSDETYCYNYDKDGDGTNADFDGTLGGCGAGNYGDSTDNAKDYYDSLAGEGNQNGDVEVDNIWGKLYTWYSNTEGEGVNLDNNNDGIISEEEDDEVCGEGYHIPSDAEWEYAEEYLYDQLNPGTSPNNCRTLDTWECNGVGWELHSTTNSINNLVVKLGLPLTGYRSADGVSFVSRGNYARLWSSTSSGDNAYFRFFIGNMSTLFRGNYDKKNSFSVRCLKD